MPVFNREKFIGEAIVSLLNQSISNFELLIVDDGSTDNTQAVITSFKDDRIKLFTHKVNKGVSAAYNLGLRNAEGFYIARMDSDDISVPDRLEKQMLYLESNPHISICGCWVKFMDSNKIIVHKETHDEILAEMLIKCPLSMGAVMYKKEDLKDFYLDESLRYGEDYDLWSRVGWKVKMYNIQEPLLLYRTHKGQLSGLNLKHQFNLDINIKLSLFKKLNYSLLKFPDDIIIKFFALNKPILLREFKIYLNWLKLIHQLNSNQKVFHPKELKKTLVILKNDLIFKIYFTNKIKDVNKKWRIKAFFYLSWNERFYILKQKVKERIKILRNG